MRGRRGLFSLFSTTPDPPEEKAPAGESFASRRRRRHSSGSDRETWSRKVEYFFAALGYAVGLGNVWRFPYLCYRNGGGAFLIPYILALILIGFPMMFLEMAFGQFASLGPVTIWRISPIFKGIGYAIVVVMILVNTYYNVLIAYALYYLFASITSVLPWSHCNNIWNTDKCIQYRCEASSLNTTLNETCSYNRTALKTPTEEYFENHLLNMTTGIHDMGNIQWPLIVCLAVSWFTCFMCLFKGIKSMGKAVIFTTIFSYLILTVLLVRGVTLPGAVNGIVYYLKPEWKKLLKLQVWGEAGAQAVASLSLGGGGWITLSSYSRFTNKCNRDSFVVGLGNALTSIYSGFVIFSVLGYMAYIKGVDVEVVTKKGPGLAFVAYPEGLALIPGAPFWSICFFFMMFTVGLDSLFGQVETIAAGIIDEYPDFLRPRRRLFTLGLCGMMFLMGVPVVMQGGIYVVTLMDWYTLLFSFSVISFFEIVAIIYVYGYARFAADIEVMLGSPPHKYFMVSWYGVTPAMLLLVIAFLGAKYVPAYYGDYYFPPWAESIGLALALCPVSLIPLVMIIQVLRKIHRPSTCVAMKNDPMAREDVLTGLVYPSEQWGPALPADRRRYSSGGSYKKKHTSGDTLGDDDVFANEAGGAELVAFRPAAEAGGDAQPAAPEENGTDASRLVHFEDETKPAERGSSQGSGGGDGAKREKDAKVKDADVAAADEKESESKKLLENEADK